MKNIHVLPTDKPSRLHKYDFDGFALSKEALNWKEAKKIYITSDEEIKEGDWVLYTKGNKIHYQKLENKNDVELANIEDSGAFKIILTTDQDLIKDGVQSIDDEFLEWFVKNPSCEFVEVTEYLDSGFSYGYKIIIPNEEPKQETLEEAAIKNCESITHPYCDREKRMFIKGVEWQQKQDKNKYSKEEVLEHLNYLNTMPSSKLDLYIDDDEMITTKWFEQFKKKIRYDGKNKRNFNKVNLFYYRICNRISFS